MTSGDRWKDISALFNAALDQPEGQRAAFLETACPDAELRGQIAALLDCLDPAAQYMAESAAQVLAAAVAADAADSSALVGRQMGSYRIDSLVDTGGMGRVYKATDTRLHRTVALKILPLALRGDAVFQERFEREARAIAALRHPHICVLHDIGREGDTQFLVMEYLEGETLAARLARGPLPDAEVLRYAIEIADALVEMHAHGIIHRDLKPANIMLTKSGAQLLDFGLARLEQSLRSPPDPDTAILPPVTQAGLGFGATARAGTLAYMAPEQVRGEAIDHRADIFAFGAVLYEMTTGARAFGGADRTALAAAVLHDDPPAIQRALGALPELETIIRTCLRKQPDERWQRTDALADALRSLQFVTDTAGLEARVAGQQIVESRMRRTRRVGWAVAAVIIGAVALWSIRTSMTGDTNDGDAPLVLGNFQQVTAADEIEFDPSFSPRGDMIAYSAGRGSDFRLVVRSLVSKRILPIATRLPTTAGAIGGSDGPFQPRWSYDGRRLLYVTREGVFAIAVDGGRPHRIASVSDERGTYATSGLLGNWITGAAWSPDNREIAVAYGAALFGIAADGSRRRRLATGPAELHWCDWSPNGRWIACAAGNPHLPFLPQFLGNIAPSAIVMVPAAGGATIEIAPATAANQSPVWSADGRRLYFVSNRRGPSDIYTVAINENGTARGDAVRLTTGLGAYSIAMSPSRTRLAYTHLSARANVWSLPVPTNDRPVNLMSARQMTAGNHVIEAMHVTPDRQWLLYDSNQHGNSDIFRVPLDGGQPTQLTSDPADDFAPAVSPDGRWLAYHSWRTTTRDVFVQPFDGGPVQQVTNTPGQESYPRWLPDGSLAFFDQAIDQGILRGTFVTRPDGRGGWTAPQRLLPPGAGAPVVMRDGGLIYIRNGAIEVMREGDREPRVLKVPGDIPLGYLDLGDEDGLFMKTLDPTGKSFLWRLPLSGRPPSMLVRLDDLARPSRRWEFDVAGGHFYFTLDDRRSNIWIAEIEEH